MNTSSDKKHHSFPKLPKRERRGDPIHTTIHVKFKKKSSSNPSRGQGGWVLSVEDHFSLPGGNCTNLTRAESRFAFCPWRCSGCRPTNSEKVWSHAERMLGRRTTWLKTVSGDERRARGPVSRFQTFPPCTRAREQRAWVVALRRVITPLGSGQMNVEMGTSRVLTWELTSATNYKTKLPRGK